MVIETLVKILEDESLEASKQTYFLKSGNFSEFFSLAQTLCKGCSNKIFVKIQSEQGDGGKNDALRVLYSAPGSTDLAKNRANRTPHNSRSETVIM